MKEELFPTNEPQLSWERQHQNFEQRWPKDWFSPEKAKGRPLLPGQKSNYGNPWAGNTPLFPINDEPPLPGPPRRPLSLPPGKNEPPGDEPMPKLIRPTGEGVHSENESRFPSPFSDVGKYTPKAPSGKPDPNDALKFWEHPSPKVIPIREGKNVIEMLKARGFKLTPVDHDPFVQIAGDVIPFPSRSTLVGKEMQQSPDQIAKNRTNRILNQTLQTPNVLPIDPGEQK